MLYLCFIADSMEQHTGSLVVVASVGWTLFGVLIVVQFVAVCIYFRYAFQMLLSSKKL